MGRKKKNRNQNDTTSKVIFLITVTLQLISALVSLIERLLKLIE